MRYCNLSKKNVSKKRNILEIASSVSIVALFAAAVLVIPFKEVAKETILLDLKLLFSLSKLDLAAFWDQMTSYTVSYF